MGDKEKSRELFGSQTRGSTSVSLAALNSFGQGCWEGVAISFSRASPPCPALPSLSHTFCDVLLVCIIWKMTREWLGRGVRRRAGFRCSRVKPNRAQSRVCCCSLRALSFRAGAAAAVLALLVLANALPREPPSPDSAAISCDPAVVDLPA